MFFCKALIPLFLLTNLHAQQATNTNIESITSEDTVEKVNEEVVERVEVTGSYIRRVDGEGPAPVTVLNREDFFKTGSIDVSDLLREDPAFEAVYEGSGHVRFRGQHAGNVLIMLNGMRLPKQNGGHYTSIKSLPSSVIENIELLKDGGSSLYGSDAMSGVMNYKTRRNFEGAEVIANMRTNDDTRGTQQSYIGTFGKNFNRGNILGVVQFEKSEGYREVDLGSYVNDDEVARGTQSQISYGGRYNSGEECNGKLCRFNSLPYRQSRGDDKDFSALLTGRFELGSEVTVSMLTMANRKEALSVQGPGSVDWRDTTGNGGYRNAVHRSEITNTAFLNNLDAAGAFRDDLVGVIGSFSDELGQREVETVTDSINTQLQVEGYIGDTWSWQVMLGAGFLNESAKTLTGEADQSVLRELFTSGQMDFNNGAIDLSAARITPEARNEGQMLTAKTVLTGEIDQRGMLSAAVGAEGQYESVEFQNDSAIAEGRTLGRKSANTKGIRRVQSAFVELAANPIRILELQLSGRIDSYSDVGETVNPRVAFLLRPSHKFLMRGSAGTGFRAPGLTDVNGDAQIVSAFVRDSGCPSGNCRGYSQVEKYNAEDLSPEEGTNYSVGLVAEPVKGFSFTVDQWNFEGTNTLTAVEENDYISYGNKYGSEALAEAGASIERDSSGEIVSMRMPRATNLGERTLRGVDATMNMSTPAGFFPFTLGFNNGFSYIFERSEKRFALEDKTEFDPTWKLSNTISVSNDTHFASLRALTVSSSITRDDVKLRQHSTLDLSYAYTSLWGGRFNVTVKNLLNRELPLDETQGQVLVGRPDRNLSAFSPLGRRYFMSYSQRF